MRKIFIPLFVALICWSATATAQVFPYYDAFDTYTAGQPLNGNGGLRATSHVLVTPHGMAGNCAEVQMNAAGNDTITSPAIGPLTLHTAASFYFRVIKYVGGVATRYILTSSDRAEIYVADTGFLFPFLQYTINSSHQNADSNYIKVVVPAPAFANGIPGKFRIVTYNTTGNSWLLQMDSFAVRDTFLTPPVLHSVVVNDSCRGDSTGAIAVSASGATPPYSYAWSTGDSTLSISHLAPGIYTVTVTDSLGATATLTDTVLAPQFQLLLDSLTHANASCFGSPSGHAAIYPRGGTPAYVYAWSTTPVQHTQLASALPAGTYSVTVTDANGCTISATTQVSQPPALVLSLSSTTTIVNTGTATAIVNGGTSPFTYLWTPSGQTTAIATGLTADSYTVVVTDANGCTISDSVRVTYAVGISDIAVDELQLYPVPASSVLHIAAGGQSLSDAVVTVSDLSGRVIERYAVEEGSINVSRLAEGIYILKAESKGKIYTTHISISR